MTEFKNILLAFDGSEDGMKALGVAQSMTENYEAALTVLYVHGDALERSVNIGTTPKGDSYLIRNRDFLAPGSVTMGSPPTPDQGENIIVEDDIPIHVINQAKDKLQPVGLNVSYKKLTGKPETEINNYATENDIDLIIIGNRGISGIKKLVQGSVSEKVANEAECPVFIVK